MWISKSRYEKIVNDAEEAKAELARMGNTESQEITKLKREINEERKAKEEALRYKELVREQTEADIMWAWKKMKVEKPWMNRKEPQATSIPVNHNFPFPLMSQNIGQYPGRGLNFGG